MAKASFKLPDDLLEKMSKLGSQYDQIIPKVLEAGAEPASEKAKSNLALRIGQGTKHPSESTGELLASLETSKPSQNNQGDWGVRVGIPTTTDSKGVSNALKAAVIEYGKSGQPPKPWLKPAKSQSKKACIEAIKKQFDKEVERL
nr:HK97-gp10 family putative phage morphogenesis protein [uncultured Niameybacter sp.]